MNWVFVLIGNLIMDSAIVIFAILAGVENYYRKQHETNEINKSVQSITEEIDNNSSPDIQTQMISSTTSIMDSCSSLLNNLNDDNNLKKIFTSPFLSKANYYSPFTILKMVVILTLFLIGIMLQVKGITI